MLKFKKFVEVYKRKWAIKKIKQLLKVLRKFWENYLKQFRELIELIYRIKGRKVHYWLQCTSM